MKKGEDIWNINAVNLYNRRIYMHSEYKLEISQMYRNSSNVIYSVIRHYESYKGEKSLRKSTLAIVQEQIKQTLNSVRMAFIVTPPLKVKSTETI